MKGLCNTRYPAHGDGGEKAHTATRSSGGIFWDRLIGGARYGISPVD